LEFFFFTVALFLELAKLILDVFELFVEFFHILLLDEILFSDILVLLTGVRQDNDGSDNFLAKFMKLVVTLFDFIVQGLVFDFKLLEIDQVETVGKLVLLLDDFLLIGKTVAQRDILESILMDLLVF